MTEAKTGGGTARRQRKPKADTRPAPAPAPAPTVTNRITKASAVTALLERPEGATIVQMMDATAWQAHSVRGFLAGALKKAGRTVTSDKTGDVRVYRLVRAAAA